MRRTTNGLSCLLIASMVVVCVAPSGAARASGVQQSGGASEEREQGRALLHRGKAAEALIHLERALKAFQSSGDRGGEAATQDLLGELYERQGQYDTALIHYRAAHDLYAAASAGGGGSKMSPLPGAALDASGSGRASTRDITLRGLLLGYAPGVDFDSWRSQPTWSDPRHDHDPHRNCT